MIRNDWWCKYISGNRVNVNPSMGSKSHSFRQKNNGFVYFLRNHYFCFIRQNMTELCFLTMVGDRNDKIWNHSKQRVYFLFEYVSFWRCFLCRRLLIVFNNLIIIFFGGGEACLDISQEDIRHIIIMKSSNPINTFLSKSVNRIYTIFNSIL